jgi:hypothetical protein
LNLRPAGCKPAALPSELHPHDVGRPGGGAPHEAGFRGLTSIRPVPQPAINWCSHCGVVNGQAHSPGWMVRAGTAGVEPTARGFGDRRSSAELRPSVMKTARSGCPGGRILALPGLALSRNHPALQGARPLRAQRHTCMPLVPRGLGYPELHSGALPGVSHLELQLL